MQKTRAYLEVQYGDQKPWLCDEIKEFKYVSDMMAVGDVCTFTIVADDKGETLRRLPVGALVKLRLKNEAVNGGNWTLKHLGRITERRASLRSGTIQVTSADLGWHLTSCHAPSFFQLRGRTLGDVVRPDGSFIDKSFGLQGVRVNDSNVLNRRLKQGRAALQAQMLKVLTPITAIQAEPGEAFLDVITRYCQRENLLINVSVDGYIQLWNPDYERSPLYAFECSDTRSNVLDADRQDLLATRFTEVLCVGETLQLGVQLNDPTDPNATKRRGYYRAPTLLPFMHRQTSSNAEMLDEQMAAAQAEWNWKRGLFDSHYLEVRVPDHFQLGPRGGEWLESDHMADVFFPGLSTRGRYYVQSVVCDSTVKGGDTATLILRWPYLLSAAYGVWGTRPQLSDPQDTLALLPGRGGAE